MTWDREMAMLNSRIELLERMLMEKLTPTAAAGAQQQQVTLEGVAAAAAEPPAAASDSLLAADDRNATKAAAAGVVEAPVQAVAGPIDPMVACTVSVLSVSLGSSSEIMVSI